MVSLIRQTVPIILLLGVAGCTVTNKYEPPPEVIEQPRRITADEAVAEGEAAEAQAEAEKAIAESREDELTAAGVDPQSTAPVPAQGQAAGEAAPAAATTSTETAAAATTPAAVPLAVALQAAAPASRSERYAPSGLSTQEIREQHRNSGRPEGFGQWMDHTHDRIYTWSQGMVEATDHRFAPKDAQMLPVPAAPFRFAVMTETVNHSDGLGFDLDVDMDIALKLPNIEKRMKVFVTSSELDESPNSAGGDPQLRAGLRYEFKRDVDLDIGVRVDWPPVLFASARWTREFEMTQKWSFYPLFKLFAETEDSVGYAAAATFDRWSGRHLFRSSSYTKYRADRNRNEWSQTLIYARAHQLIVPDRYGSYIDANDIGNGWGLRLFGKDEGKFEGEDGTEYYEVGVFWRKPTKNRWLYWHFEPIVRWDKKYAWATDLGVRIGFDALFWDLARPAR